MQSLRGTGWLLVGLLLALVVPALGLAARLGELLDSWAPLPWGAIGLGLLLFWAGAGLYFRSHWVATLRALRTVEAEAADAARRLDSVIADGERWSYVLRDNLLELRRGDLPADQARLYLEGAVSHADKVRELVERCRGARARLSGLPGTAPDGDGE